MALVRSDQGKTNAKYEIKYDCKKHTPRVSRTIVIRMLHRVQLVDHPQVMT